MSLYFIAILPPPTTVQKIRSVQMEFADKYNSSHQLKVPVHITLIPPFKEEESIEEILTQTLVKFAQQKERFTLSTSGFGSFRNKVIYVGVEFSDQLQTLQSSLKIWLKENCPIAIPEHFETFTPHLTVANRDLTKGAFNDAWSVFETRPFKTNFNVNKITLLKHNGSTWDVFKKFPLAEIV